MGTTPLGRMGRHPEVLLALAQDQLAAMLAPFLHLPDLLAGEDGLLEDWARQRPAVAAEADLAVPADWSRPLREFRLRLRRAALRRLDAAATGREIFLPCPAYFGEPYLAFDLAPGLGFKAGVVQQASYWSFPEGAARSRAWRLDSRLVAAVEARLFPLLSPDAPADKVFPAAATRWLGLGPLRAFESRSPLPLFPRSTIYPEGWVPPGFACGSGRRRCRPWAAVTSRSPRPDFRLTSPSRSWTIAWPGRNGCGWRWRIPEASPPPNGPVWPRRWHTTCFHDLVILSSTFVTLIHMKHLRWVFCCLLPLAALRSTASADTHRDRLLATGRATPSSRWPTKRAGPSDAGSTRQKLVWFDYGPSIDAFSAGKIDANCVVASDAMGAGAAGAKAKFIALIDYSEGSDMIVGKPGITSIKDLKGQKVGVELTLVEHMLLIEGLQRNGMSANDVTLVGTSTNNTPQTLASGSVAAIGAWYPISYQALTQVPGSSRSSRAPTPRA